LQHHHLSLMSYLDPALRIIKEFEGLELKAYKCPAGVWTIGYGTTRINGRPVGAGMSIDTKRAEELLRKEIEDTFAPAVFDLLPMARSWTPKQQAAIISFAFNLGVGSLERSTLRKRLLAGEPADKVVREELPRWNKVGGSALPGLSRRRAAEVALFTGAQPSKVKMVGPTKRPRDFGFGVNDHHLVVNDEAETCKCFTSFGVMLWEVPALARGQGGDREWTLYATDTPPGLYKIGAIYRDYERNSAPTYSADRASYGWYSFDLEELEGQEVRHGRAGIMIHGGGTSLGWPGAWAPRQRLVPTLGCVRMHNADLRDKVLPLAAKGIVYVSVFQEA